MLKSGIKPVVCINKFYTDTPMGYVSGVDTYSWSMSTYVSRVRSRLGELAEADEAWDELEKSIVANLADEVTVNIVGNAVKIVITKAF